MNDPLTHADCEGCEQPFPRDQMFWKLGFGWLCPQCKEKLGDSPTDSDDCQTSDTP